MMTAGRLTAWHWDAIRDIQEMKGLDKSVRDRAIDMVKNARDQIRVAQIFETLRRLVLRNEPTVATLWGATD